MANRNILTAAALSTFFTIMSLPVFAGTCDGLAAAARSTCEEVLRQMNRNTQGRVTAFADHCDAALVGRGEPLTMNVVPRGQPAFSQQAVPLTRLSWAAQSRAGERFAQYGLRDERGYHVVERELCANREVWRQQLARLGISRTDIESGRWEVHLCGRDYSHRLPAARVLAILDGRQSRGQYSVLSRRATEAVAADLTSRGY